MHRQKVAEVEKLMQSVRELEEAVLAGGAAANAVRDYQRRFQEMNVIIATGTVYFFLYFGLCNCGFFFGIFLLRKREKFSNGNLPVLRLMQTELLL